MAPPGSILPAPQKTSDVRTKFATILVYSMPRFGKTNLIRTLVEHGFRVLILATDQGHSSGFQSISDLNVTYVKIENWEQALAVFTELAKKKHLGICQYQGEEFDVVVNDSLSGFGDIWMAKGLEVLGWDEVGVAEPGKDPRRIYAYIPEKGRQTCKALMNLPAHLILICRETMMEEGEGRSKITYPAPELPGAKLPRELPGWLDAVVFGKVVNGNRQFLTQIEGKVVAGIRTPPDRQYTRMIHADYSLLIKSMMGDETARHALLIGSLEPMKVGVPKQATPTATTTKETVK